MLLLLEEDMKKKLEILSQLDTSGDYFYNYLNN
jgi:hypothetical protein